MGFRVSYLGVAGHDVAVADGSHGGDGPVHARDVLAQVEIESKS